jgi:hypothetical protein
MNLDLPARVGRRGGDRGTSVGVEDAKLVDELER